MRGNGKAAVSPEGVRSSSDVDMEELRARLQRSHKFTPANLMT